MFIAFRVTDWLSSSGAYTVNEMRASNELSCVSAFGALKKQQNCKHRIHEKRDVIN